MNKTYYIILLFIGSLLKVSAQGSCLTPESLKALDASWEKALLEMNVDFIKDRVSDDFIWIHNHARRVDSKASLLRSHQNHLDNNTRNAKSRTQKEVNVIITGNTGVVTGFTEVVKSNGISRTTYNFMRTYAVIDGRCCLLANHTMAIPPKEDD